MGKLTKKTNYKVLVKPRARGDFGFASISGMEWTPDQEKRICEEIIEGIYKAAKADIIEDVGRVGLDWETDEVCEYCGEIWTEGDGPHNGGCCPQDMDIMDNTN